MSPYPINRLKPVWTTASPLRHAGFQSRQWDALLWFALLALSSPALWAQSITEIQQLDFGRFAIGSNSLVSTLSVPADGTPPRPTGTIYIIEPGSRGIYQLSGYPPETALTITISASGMTTVNQRGAESFSINNIDSALIVMSSTTGSATLYLGATLQSSGSGTGYANLDYRATINVTVNCGTC